MDSNQDIISGNEAVTYKKGTTSLLVYICKNYSLYLMLIPCLIYMLIFKYLPMYGIVIAFKDFNFAKGIFGSDWIGLANFRTVFFSGPDFYIVLKNSLLLSIYSMLWGFPAPIILAILINEIRHNTYKRTLQTVLYLPHFISWVIIAGIVINFLSPSTGLVNYIIKAFGGTPIAFLQKQEYFRSIIISANIWKETGWGTILYLAAITNIDPQIYEAAIIDGANRFSRIRYITLPGILSTVVIMLILRIGSLLSNGFEQIFLLYSPLTYSVADVFETYTYRVGLQLGQYSYSTAVGLFNSVVSFVLIILSNQLSRKYGEYSIM